MLAFLGLTVHHPLINKYKYREALQQIKHYLSCKHKVEIHQNQFVLTLCKEQLELSIVKNHNYLHTNFYNIPLFSSQDWELLDIYYECLMILRESFPAFLTIQLITEEQSKEISDFLTQKEQEFNRRVNSNLKTIAQQNSQLESQDIEQIIYLTINNYNRKNKSLGLKIILNKIQESNVSNLGQEWLQMLETLQQAQYKKVITEIIKKVKTFQFTVNRNKENKMTNNNVNVNSLQPLKLNALLFQLKESYNIQRVCNLLSAALNQDQNSQLLPKMEKAINLVTNRFLEDSYQQGPIYASEFCDLIKVYWLRRGKKIDQSLHKNLQLKERQVSEQNRSKLLSSRKI